MNTCFLLIFSLCILVVPCLADSKLPSRSLIVFYSRSGFSRTIAEKMASYIGNTDLFELIPAEEDMLELGAWTFVKWAFRALWGSDCELKNKEIDLSKYDNIWLGGPIHSWTIPTPLRSWVQSHKDELAKKQLGFFCTGGGPQGYSYFFAALQDITGVVPSATIAIKESEVPNWNAATELVEVKTKFVAPKHAEL